MEGKKNKFLDEFWLEIVHVHRSIASIAIFISVVIGNYFFPSISNCWKTRILDEPINLDIFELIYIIGDKIDMKYE